MKISLRKIALNALLIVVTAACIFPFYIMLIMSTYSTSDLSVRINLFPGTYLAENLKTVFESPMWVFYWNSIYIAVTTTFLSVFMSALAGYGIEKYNFKFKKLVFNIIIATMLIPGQLSLIGFVMEISKLGMAGTHWPLILPAASSFGVFWMASYIREGIPSEVIESARVDGSNEFMTFFRIGVPLIKPAIGTLTLIGFLASWNNFMLPLVILNEEKLFTIPLGIKNFGSIYRADLGAQVAAISIATVPVLIILSFFNKTLVRGLISGSVKG